MSPRRKSESKNYYAILGFFIEGPYYGYSLYKKIKSDTTFQKIWYLKQSQFYAFLDKLQTEKMLSFTIYEGDNYPDRKEYQITDLGMLTFNDWVVTPVERGRDMRQEFLIKLFFALKMPDKIVHELITRQKQAAGYWFDEFQKLKHQDEFFDQIVNQYRLNQIQAMIEWLEFVDQKIK